MQARGGDGFPGQTPDEDYSAQLNGHELGASTPFKMQNNGSQSAYSSPGPTGSGMKPEDGERDDLTQETQKQKAAVFIDHKQVRHFVNSAENIQKTSVNVSEIDGGGPACYGGGFEN